MSGSILSTRQLIEAHTLACARCTACWLEGAAPTPCYIGAAYRTAANAANARHAWRANDRWLCLDHAPPRAQRTELRAPATCDTCQRVL